MKIFISSIRTLVDKGYARKMTPEEASRYGSRMWYLPHHAVIHPQKPEKLRVVFDAAARLDGVSLNNQLYQGPDFTNDLLGILLRFRQEAVAVVGDVEAMFLQVKVAPEDADSLRKLESPLEEYQMLRHIFGATDSPSCCSYALKQVAKENAEDFSAMAVDTVKKDFYVDDLLTAVPTEETAILIVKEVSEMLQRGGFHIRNWVSNSRAVLNSIPEKERVTPSLDLDLDRLPIQRTRGVQWNVENDLIQFTITEQNKPFTKRGILSAMSSVYDPIGLVAPTVLVAKKIIQQLWKSQLGWDNPLPEEERRKWMEWKTELQVLTQIQVPRCYMQMHEEVADISLHFFADASEEGYGMCAYLRFVFVSGVVQCAFVLGRSRCAPLRSVTIPRLELQAETLAVKMYNVIKDEMTYRVEKVVFWTDSQTTLQYIHNETKRFQVYVANRVAEIREATSADQWKHCPGILNPADDASRGLRPQKLLDQGRWWKGPEFLWKPEEFWPNTCVGELEDTDPEVCRVQVHQVAWGKPESVVEGSRGGLQKIIDNTSTWRSLQRRVAWMKRFCTWVSRENSPL